MKQGKVLAAACAALLFAGSAHAGLSSLAVNFSPAVTDFHAGEAITVTAAGNGTGMQYDFQLDKIVAKLPVRVSERYWGAAGNFSIDGSTLSAGTYRLTVKSREKANYRETLVKTEYFNVLDATAVGPACDRIKGKTFSNPLAASPTVDLGCPGFLCLGALDAFALPGLALPAASFGSALGAVTFGTDGTLTLNPMPVNLVSGLGGGQVSGSLAGTYTCSGNVVSYDATGAVGISGSSGLMGLFTGQALYLHSTGSLTVDSVLDRLTAGAAVLQ